MKHFFEKIQPFAPALIGTFIFCFGYFLFFSPTFISGYDMNGYLSIARNFADGKGMVDGEGNLSMHRMGYKLLLAEMLRLGNGESLYWVAFCQAFFGASFLLGVYVLGAKLYRPVVGVVSVILICAFPYMIFLLRINGTDVVWPTFVIWALISYLDNGQTLIRRYGLPVLAGLLAASAFWIKEMGAVFFLPVPVLLYAMKNGGSGRRLFVFYVSTFVCIGIGMLCYHSIQTSAVAPSDDISSEGKAVSTAFSALLTLFGSDKISSSFFFTGSGFLRYFFYVEGDRGLSAFYLLIYLFPFSLLYHIHETLFPSEHKKESNNSSKVIIALVLSYLPFLIWAGQWNMRQTEIMIVVVIAMISVTELTLKLFKLFPLGGGAVLAVVILIQYVNGMSYMDGAKEGIFVGNVKPEAFLYKMNGVQYSEWLEQHLGQGENVMVTDAVIWHRVSWGMKGRHTVFLGPYRKNTPGLQENSYVRWFDSSDEPYDCVALRYYPYMRYGEAYFFSGAEIRKEISEKHIRFLVLADQKTDRLLLNWLRASKNIKEYGFEETPSRFIEILPEFVNEKTSDEACIDSLFIGYLQSLEKTEPRFFDWYKEKIFKKGLGMTDRQFLTRMNADAIQR